MTTRASSNGQTWTSSHDDILESFGVSPDRGLDGGEVERRREKYGGNRLREIKQESAWAILVDQFESPIMALLAVAAGLSFGFGQSLEGYAIIGVILLTVAIGFFTEIKAVRSMEALRRVSRVRTNVRRRGKVERIAATELVPGDMSYWRAETS